MSGLAITSLSIIMPSITEAFEFTLGLILSFFVANFAFYVFVHLILPLLYILAAIIVFLIILILSVLLLIFSVLLSFCKFVLFFIFSVFHILYFLITHFLSLILLISLYSGKLVIFIIFSVSPTLDYLISLSKPTMLFISSVHYRFNYWISPFLSNLVLFIVINICSLFYILIPRRPLPVLRKVLVVLSVFLMLNNLLLLPDLVVQHNSPPSQSNPTVHHGTFEVFLNFRGEDVRNAFVRHLYDALVQKHIYTFMDDRKTKKGGTLSKDLFKAIEKSSFAIVILSKNYASSSWCLDELVKIMECKKKMGQIVFPVFYHVDPSDVRKQRGSFGEALAKHKDAKKVKVWKQALVEVAGLVGWHVDHTANRDEAKCIKEIVAATFHGLNEISDVDKSLIGIKDRMMSLELLLSIGSGNVHMIGVFGKEGAGKTTVTEAVYKRIADQFEGKSYVENVKELYDRCGRRGLQRRVLSDLLMERNSELDGLNYGRMISTRLRQTRVLLVLDDVDDSDQLVTVAGNHVWFGTGSRIVIVTRDKELLLDYGIDEGNTHDVKLLDDDEAVQLLSRHAFKNNSPPDAFEGLSLRVVRYAAGYPLALKVMGSFLHGKSTDAWESELASLNHDQQNENAQEILKRYGNRVYI